MRQAVFHLHAAEQTTPGVKLRECDVGAQDRAVMILHGIDILLVRFFYGGCYPQTPAVRGVPGTAFMPATRKIKIPPTIGNTVNPAL